MEFKFLHFSCIHEEQHCGNSDLFIVVALDSCQLCCLLYCKLMTFFLALVCWQQRLKLYNLPLRSLDITKLPLRERLGNPKLPLRSLDISKLLLRILEIVKLSLRFMYVSKLPLRNKIIF